MVCCACFRSHSCFCRYLDQADAIEAQRASRYSQKQILEFLSPSLRQEVVLYTNAGLLSRLPSLARQNPDVQAFIVERLRRQAVSILTLIVADQALVCPAYEPVINY